MGSLFAADEEEIPQDVEAAADEAAGAVPGLSERAPRTTAELLGHEEVEAALLADYSAGRLPHAIILAGPSGIGKATLAYRLARFLFAQGGAEAAGLFGAPEKPKSLYIAPDNPVFRRVASGGHADLAVVEREYDEKRGRLKQDIPVETVRGIKDKLRQKAAEGGWRIALVDSAEYLNQHGQNALLKILEEPPPKSLLILTTSQPGAFLPTIRSRCRMVRMEPLGTAAVAELLGKFAPGIGDGDKEAVSRYAEGSIGRALQFYAGGGMELYKELLSVVAAIPAIDVVKLQDMAEKTGRDEQSYETARDIMTGWCERIVRLQARGEPLSDVMPGDSAVFRRLMDSYPPRHFLDAWEKMSHLFRQSEWSNLDKRQALIGAFLMLQNPDHPGLSL